MPLSPTQILKTCIHFSIINRSLFFRQKIENPRLDFPRPQNPFSRRSQRAARHKSFLNMVRNFTCTLNLCSPKNGNSFLKISGCKVQNLKGAILINPNFCTQHFWSSLARTELRFKTTVCIGGVRT